MGVSRVRVFRVLVNRLDVGTDLLNYVRREFVDCDVVGRPGTTHERSQLPTGKWVVDALIIIYLG